MCNHNHNKRTWAALIYDPELLLETHTISFFSDAQSQAVVQGLVSSPRSNAENTFLICRECDAQPSKSSQLIQIFHIETVLRFKIVLSE